MSWGDRKHALRRRFHAQNGLCHWCQQPMLPPGGPTKKKEKPDRMLCTYDHLDDRFSPERGKRGGELRFVAACWGCNTERGRVSQASQPIEVLRERSGRHGSKKNHGQLKVDTSTDINIVADSRTFPASHGDLNDLSQQLRTEQG